MESRGCGGIPGSLCIYVVTTKYDLYSDLWQLNAFFNIVTQQWKKRKFCENSAKKFGIIRDLSYLCPIKR